jgi:hypothetical protein
MGGSNVGQAAIMRRFARWHIWLGWLAGVPLVMWTLTGLVMVARPIEEVRGNHLRIERESEALPALDLTPAVAALKTLPAPATELSVVMAGKDPVMIVQLSDGSIARFSAADGSRLPQISEKQARATVAQDIAGGDQVSAVTAFPASDPPFDFRNPVPVWQVSLHDGTHVYVNRDTGRIAAVRTRWWRVFDVMWGLHIMDLQTRENTHHPVLILFATIGFIMSVIGCVLMFRRRKTRVRA